MHPWPASSRAHQVRKAALLKVLLLAQSQVGADFLPADVLKDQP